MAAATRFGGWDRTRLTDRLASRTATQPQREAARSVPCERLARRRDFFRRSGIAVTVWKPKRFGIGSPARTRSVPPGSVSIRRYGVDPRDSRVLAPAAPIGRGRLGPFAFDDRRCAGSSSFRRTVAISAWPGSWQGVERTTFPALIAWRRSLFARLDGRHTWRTLATTYRVETDVSHSVTRPVPLRRGLSCVARRTMVRTSTMKPAQRHSPKPSIRRRAGSVGALARVRRVVSGVCRPSLHVRRRAVSILTASPSHQAASRRSSFVRPRSVQDIRGGGPRSVRQAVR